MKRSGRIIAGVALASLAFAAPASAQDSGSMAVGNATVSVGGGTAILTLPDVEFIKRYDTSGAIPFPLLSRQKNSDDFGDEIGWNVNGSISSPMGANRTISLSGFWSEIDDADTLICSPVNTNSCNYIALIDDPNSAGNFGFAQVQTFRTSRDVNHWGVSLEGSRQSAPSVMGVTRAPNPRTLSVGADIRGIDQDLRLVGTFGDTYTEDLDTRYYGAYAAWGGDTSPLLFKGLWERWGLQSSFRLQGGVYYADTDYSGRIAGTGLADGSLSLSTDDVAFIGGLTLDTRKRIGRRATLSLKSDYEYYSYVPDMRYNDVDTTAGGGTTNYTGPNDGTRIGDDDAFSARTSLRLTIKLGPDSLFEEPLK